MSFSGTPTANILVADVARSEWLVYSASHPASKLSLGIIIFSVFIPTRWLVYLNLSFVALIPFLEGACKRMVNQVSALPGKHLVASQYSAHWAYALTTLFFVLMSLYQCLEISSVYS